MLVNPSHYDQHWNQDSVDNGAKGRRLHLTYKLVLHLRYSKKSNHSLEQALGSQYDRGKAGL